MSSKLGTLFLLGRKAMFYEFGIGTGFDYGADVEKSLVVGVLRTTPMSWFWLCFQTLFDNLMLGTPSKMYTAPKFI